MEGKEEQRSAKKSSLRSATSVPSCVREVQDYFTVVSSFSVLTYHDIHTIVRLTQCSNERVYDAITCLSALPTERPSSIKL